MNIATCIAEIFAAGFMNAGDFNRSTPSHYLAGEIEFSGGLVRVTVNGEEKIATASIAAAVKVAEDAFGKAHVAKQVRRTHEACVS